MNFHEIYTRLKERFGGAVIDKNEDVHDPFIVIDHDAVSDIMALIKNDDAFDCSYLACISGVDYPEKAVIDVVYHMYSYGKRHKIVLKVHVPRTNPAVPSVTSLWKGADWLEREVYDMFGVVFAGHPALRRILCPEDWEGHPLRKDYQEPDSYHGIPNKPGKRSCNL